MCRRRDICYVLQINNLLSTMFYYLLCSCSIEEHETDFVPKELTSLAAVPLHHRSPSNAMILLE